MKVPTKTKFGLALPAPSQEELVTYVDASCYLRDELAPLMAACLGSPHKWKLRQRTKQPWRDFPLSI
jgi:hypothetical protein